jgi:hypothetical protein
MFKTLQRSTIIRLLATTAAAVAIAAVGAVPASAFPLAVDHPLINAANLDFGDGAWAGSPAIGRTLEWDAAAGLVKPHLTGKLYATNLNGRRIRMRIQYHDAGHQPVFAKYGGIVTPNGNGLNTWSVDLTPPGAINIFHLHVAITQENVPGPGDFVMVGKAIEQIRTRFDRAQIAAWPRPRPVMWQSHTPSLRPCQPAQRAPKHARTCRTNH